MIRVQIGDGPVSSAIPHPALDKATLHLSFPEPFAGHRVQLCIERATQEGREEWMRLSPRLLADGTLQIAGGDDRLPTTRVLRMGHTGSGGTATFDLN